MFDFLKFLVRSRRDTTLLLFFVLVASLCNVAFGSVLKLAIDTLTSAMYAPPNAMLMFSAIFVGLRLLTPLMHGTKELICSRISDDSEILVRSQAFTHIHSLDYEFHATKNTGEILKLVNSGITSFKTLIRCYFLTVIPVLLDITLILGVIYYFFGWLFSFSMLIMVLLYAGSVILMTRQRMKTLRHLSDAEQKISSFNHESLLNIESLKLFGGLEFENNRHTQLLELFNKNQARSRKSLYGITLVTSVIAALACLAILSLASSQVIENKMTVGGYFMLTTFLFQIFMPLNSLGLSFRQIARGQYELSKLITLLSVSFAPVERNEVLVIKKEDGLKIEIENLCLNTQEGTSIFSHLDYVINIRRPTYLVGKSGIGKTSLVRLISGLARPTKGYVKLNGISVENATEMSLRSCISIATQDAILFNDTLRNNLKMAAPLATDEELQKVCAAVGLQENLPGSPLNLDGVLGERGQRLSGGQKQRVSVARALLKRSPVIIFDEPTSSLDVENVNTIKELIRRVATHSLVLVITHDTQLLPDNDYDIYTLTESGISHGKVEPGVITYHD
ncbi:ABC transporter ATP-binding protein [Pseudomonas piscis]|uniref:ABC transporter ATP-binding protein n=1 Tax=Pseudomonas piscis TaxID=2614538 RepID=A0ABY9NJP7_9PSED|nr:ABC transporter ATP-binding protein [Pseudomonas piscis]WMN18769.1 ABC transporter ATP-binding protein [Pseudomonas piscis]